MCGRFTYRYTWQRLSGLMGLVRWPSVEITPRYNVAPSQTAPVVRLSADGTREGDLLRWGLVPSWSDAPSIGHRYINARAETVGVKSAFRIAFSRQRCLVPVSGFYEWRVLRDGTTKQPYLISRTDGEPFALAGLWDRCVMDGAAIESFTIITTSPNELMSRLHDRMPVVIDESDFDRWLEDVPLGDAERSRLLGAKPWDGFEMFPVGRLVNSPKIDAPEVSARVAEPDESEGFLF
ncbi:MAG: SOS response-associated peptidase [Phycisphaerales bacterium]|jgi:putative SOS response-associated peptidase YedK|nr:SOS response-associated peptidase [Phycisphaerales bacterium]